MTLLGIQSARRILNNRLFVEDIILKRAAVGEYVRGVWTEAAAPAPVTLKASVNPATGRQRETLPEGYRLRDAFIMYIATLDYDLVQPMRKGVGKSDQDVINYKGQDYSVYSVPDDYSSHGFVGVLVVREDD